MLVGLAAALGRRRAALPRAGAEPALRGPRDAAVAAVQRITARGAGNLDIITLLFRYLRPLVWWGLLAAACAVVARTANGPRRVPRITWLFAASALAITLTLLASPKQGGRLYLASVALACVAAATLVQSQLQAGWARLVAWGLAALFAIRVGATLVGVYAAVGPEGHDRLARIRSAPPGSTLTVPAYSRPRSRWFMGDDFALSAGAATSRRAGASRASTSPARAALRRRPTTTEATIDPDDLELRQPEQRHGGPGRVRAGHVGDLGWRPRIHAGREVAHDVDALAAWCAGRVTAAAVPLELRAVVTDHFARTARRIRADHARRDERRAHRGALVVARAELRARATSAHTTTTAPARET